MLDNLSDIKQLHPLEVKVLLAFAYGDRVDASALVEKLGFKEGHANQAFSWLMTKGLLEEVSRKSVISYEITKIGKAYAKDGTIEERILTLLKAEESMSLPEIAKKLNLEQKDVGSAFGSLSKMGAVLMDEQKKAFLKNSNFPKELSLTRSLLEKASGKCALQKEELNDSELKIISSLSKKRGGDNSAFKTVEKEFVTYRASGNWCKIKEELEKQGITGDEIGEVTPEILKSGEWKGKNIRPYNIALQPARVIVGRTNPYVRFLERIKDRLCGLGFQEFDGSLVESEFWNADALFMPQFHAARDIHDVYRIKNPTHAKEIKEPFLSRVANVHENGGGTGSRGWNYKFDTEFTRRLVLRSQGTVLSAHKLKDAEIPGKYFGIVRCFRYDKVDATHLSDFYQTEGIVLGKDVNLKTLLGFLRMFATELAGAEEVKYVPGYFPFTEPSIEVHIKHPVLGWFELGGSGIFRPEVTAAMGVDVPVLAWGIGIDRMALMALGLSDLRELFSEDIEKVRLRKASF